MSIVSELQNPSQDDHLGSRFLLPRTLEGFPAERGMELEAIHDFLRLKALNAPTNLLEQANAILNGISEDSKFEFAHQLPPKNDNREGTANDADHPQRRRPALGRKRARFSFKISQSEPTSHVESSLDIDNLQDPDEFFAAHERIENAEKELKKSRGDTLDDPIQHHMDTTVRSRRPGILGKNVSYKHLYPTVGGDENLVPSQEEKSNMKIPRSSTGTFNMLSSNSSHPEAGQLGESQERETHDDDECLTVIQGKGSIVETENKVNKLLEELLFSCKGLDEGEVVSLLQERLQVKPITLDKISLPDLGSVQRNDLMTSQRTVSRPRKPLSDLQQVTKSTANRKMPVKSSKKAESFKCSLTSPTPPRSPFASMSILKKRFLQIDPLRDPFSMSLGADVSSAKQPCSIEGLDKQTLSPHISTNQLDTKSLHARGDSVPPKIDGKGSSLDGTSQSSFLAEDNIVGSDVNSGKLPIVDSACLSERPTDETTNKFDNDVNIMSDGLDSNLQDKASVFDNDVNIMSNGLDSNLQDEPQLKDMLLKVSVNPVLERGPEGLTSGIVHCNENQQVTSLPMDEQQSENSSISIELHDKEHPVPSTTSPKRQTKQKVPQQKRIDKEAPPCSRNIRESRYHRQSLAGSGTLFESGIRRSTRIKSRPLEYWRGERFLYGRIHNSLPTVIGMKYASPDKGGKEPMLKVKSYVSEEFAELVEIAALH